MQTSKYVLADMASLSSGALSNDPAAWRSGRGPSAGISGLAPERFSRLNLGRFQLACWLTLSRVYRGNCHLSTAWSNRKRADPRKGALVQLTKSLAVAWARDNIQVNAALPGWIDSELTRAARRQVAGLHERVLARTPAGRWGVPEDLAGIAVFLASVASDFVAGAAIPVDGGFSAMG
jgi:NAD(P)-dependent dehydrogenase (short-subunit alcohol dehydrogenase family)